MRPRFGVSLLSALAYLWVPLAFSADVTAAAPTDAGTSPVALQICTFNWTTEGGTESRYLLDLVTRELGVEQTYRTPKNIMPECAKAGIAKSKHAGEVYERIAQRVQVRRNQAPLDKSLLKTVDWIEESTKWGASKASWLLASPNGSYALFVGRDQPLLLIEVEELRTRLLSPAHQYLRTPAAWSADSTLVAFAPPDTDKLHVYSMAAGAVIATMSGTGPWVEELSWSPNMRDVAVVALENRRMNKTPLGLLGAMAGHPEYRNDGVVKLYAVKDGASYSRVLKRGISEMSSPRFAFEWK